jgi:hypothetical protein
MFTVCVEYHNKDNSALPTLSVSIFHITVLYYVPSYWIVQIVSRYLVGQTNNDPPLDTESSHSTCSRGL